MNAAMLMTAMETTHARGGIAVAADKFGLMELVTFPHDGPAALHQVDFPYLGREPRTQHGVEMIGVMRRNRVLRQFVSCEPEDVALGDKLVLRSEEGEQIKTSKVKEIIV